MKVIICDKCKKPVNFKDVRHIVVRTEETEHVLDFCSCCYFAIVESIESLEDLGKSEIDSCRKVISDSKKAALNKMIDEGELSSTQIALKLDLKPKTVANYKGRYLKAKKSEQAKKVVSRKKAEESILPKKEDIEPNAVLPEVANPVILEKKPVGRPRKKKKIDTAKAKALLGAGWSYEKIARSEFYCSVEELKEALEESKSH